MIREQQIMKDLVDNLGDELDEFISSGKYLLFFL